MKRFETIKNFMKTHKKKKQTKKNALKIFIKNRLSREQMLIIKNCNMSNLKILSEMLKNVKQKKINRIIEFISLIIKQRVFHSNRDVNTKLLFTTIDTVLITNYSIELKKVKVIKKAFDAKKYVIDHLRLRRAITKVFDFNKRNNAKKTNAIKKINDHEESKEEEKK